MTLVTLIGAPRAAHASRAPDALPEEVASLLARPVSPATIALLLPHASRDAVQQRWREALFHPTPGVRAAAARVVFVAGTDAQVADVQRALAVEQDEAVALEQLLCVVVRGDPSAAEAAAAAALRLQGRVAVAYLEILSARRPAQALAKLATFAPVVPGATLGVALASAVGAFDADHSEIVRRALAAGADAWAVMLRRHPATSPLRVEWMREVLAARSREPAFATDLGWEVARRAPSHADDVRSLMAEWVDAIAGADPMERAAFVLARRALGDAAADVDIVRGMDDDRVAELAWRLTPALSAHLSDGEAAQLRARTGYSRPPVIDRDAASSTSTAASPRPIPRTMGPFPQGFVDDVVRVAGCREKNAWLGAVATFSVDGRPAWLRMDDGQLDPRCASVRDVLAATTVMLPSSTQRPRGYRLATSLGSKGSRCAGELAMGTARYRAERWSYRATPSIPRLRHEQRPWYTEAALRARVEGVVEAELAVTAEGCVGSAELVMALDMLNDAALAALQRWEFLAPTVAGRAQPTVVTVQMSFNLRK